jgi:hypothetical protein
MPIQLMYVEVVGSHQKHHKLDDAILSDPSLCPPGSLVSFSVRWTEEGSVVVDIPVISVDMPVDQWGCLRGVQRWHALLKVRICGLLNWFVIDGGRDLYLRDERRAALQT